MFNFEKIFNKKKEEVQDSDVVVASEDVQALPTEEKTLEYYEEKKEALLGLYKKRSEEAVTYQNTKDRIDALASDATVKEALLKQAHTGTLGVVNEHIQEITQEGLGLTSQEHYEAREKMLQDELHRIEEHIEAFKQQEIYPQNERAQQLLGIKETIHEQWNKDLSGEAAKEILSTILGENNVYERRYTHYSTISSAELSDAIDKKLEEISDSFSVFGELKSIVYKEMLQRKDKINRLRADWDHQNRKNTHS